jgi:hypothetical protein
MTMAMLKGERYWRDKIGDDIKQAMMDYSQEGVPISKLVLMEEAEKIARGEEKTS